MVKHYKKKSTTLIIKIQKEYHIYNKCELSQDLYSVYNLLVVIAILF
jgi:hypothetical protein